MVTERNFEETNLCCLQGFSHLEAVKFSLSSIQEACDKRSGLTWEMQLISERESKFLTL